MQTEFALPTDIHLDDRQRARLSSALAQLEERLGRYGHDPATLHVSANEPPSGDLMARAELRLDIEPQAEGSSGLTLTAQAEAPEPWIALDSAYRQLLAKHDGLRLDMDAALRRRVETRRVRPVMVGPGEHDGIDTQFLRKVVPILDRVAHLAILERQLSGELEPSWLDPAEVVDEAVTERFFYGRGEGGSAGRSFASLRRRVEDIISEAVREYRDRRLDQPLSEPAVDAVELAMTELGQDLYTYWTTEEDAPGLVDVDLSGVTDGPAAAGLVEERQTRHALVCALFALPDEERLAFSEVVIHCRGPEEVATSMGREPRDVERMVEAAATSIAIDLVGREPLGVEEVKAVYRALGNKLGDARYARRKQAEPKGVR